VRVQASPSTAVVMSPTRRVHINRPRHSGMLGVTMSASVLLDRLQEITGRRISGPIVFDPSVDLTRGPGRLLCEAIRALKTALESQEAGSGSSVRQSLLEDALISAILTCPATTSANWRTKRASAARPGWCGGRRNTWPLMSPIRSPSLA
jgi:hypothetical protein